jgi:hypothetical protein
VLTPRGPMAWRRGIAISLLLLLYRVSRPYVAVLGREAADEGRPSIPTYRSVREAVEAVGHPSGVMRRHPAST